MTNNNEKIPVSLQRYLDETFDFSGELIAGSRSDVMMNDPVLRSDQT